MNRVIHVLAEGNTERAARDRLKRFLDCNAGNRPKVRIHITPLDGCLRKKDVETLCRLLLAEDGVVGVLTLPDVYPGYPDAESARKTIQAWMPSDPRCHSCAALHDFEAWLLCDWQAILDLLGIKGRKPPGANPEGVNHLNPPAHRLQALFQSKQRRYKKPVDGKKLFDQLDLDQAASLCAELKRFLNALLMCAGYPLLS